MPINTYFWRIVPSIQFLFPFLTGTVIATNHHFSYVLEITIGIFCAFFLLKIFRKQNNSQLYAPIFQALFWLFLFGAGLYWIQIHRIPPQLSTGKSLAFMAIVDASPVVKAKTVSVVARLVATNDSADWKDTYGRINLYIEKDSAAETLKYGDFISFYSQIHEIRSSGNPNSFDFGKYLAKKQIYHQTYLTELAWTKIDAGHGNPILETAYATRDYLLSVYEKHGIENAEFAVAAALTLGYKDHLDEETRNAYSASGAMHILAVSGLHVGIIFGILKYLFDTVLIVFARFRYWKLTRAISIISLIWFFAFITGLPLSVQRASLMLTIIVIGESTHRKSSVYNSLLISAFIVLLLDPFSATEVGFQLSYFAVASIVFFQPKLACLIYFPQKITNDSLPKWHVKLLNFKNKTLDYFWQLFTVSIAAQVGTFAIGMLYFHQFPTWFFITNLIVIPFAGLVLLSAVSLFIVSAIPYLGAFIALILNGLLLGLNFSVNYIEQLPYSKIAGISFGVFEVILLAILSGSLLLFIAEKARRALIVCAISTLVFLVFTGAKRFEKRIRKQLVVYNVYRYSAVDFISGENSYLLTNKKTKLKSNPISFATSGHKLALGIEKTDTIFVEDLQWQKIVSANDKILCQENFFYFDKSRIYFLNEEWQLFRNNSDSIKLDYLILGSDVRISIDEALKYFKPKLIIFDSSNSSWRIKVWKNECKKNKAEFYSVPDSGAFLVNL